MCHIYIELQSYSLGFWGVWIALKLFCVLSALLFTSSDLSSICVLLNFIVFNSIKHLVHWNILEEVLAAKTWSLRVRSKYTSISTPATEEWSEVKWWTPDVDLRLKVALPFLSEAQWLMNFWLCRSTGQSFLQNEEHLLMESGRQSHVQESAAWSLVSFRDFLHRNCLLELWAWVNSLSPDILRTSFLKAVQWTPLKSRCCSFRSLTVLQFYILGLDF